MPKFDKKEYQRAWRDKNKKRVRGYQLKQQYGISNTEFQDRFEKQMGQCAICKRGDLELCVDHCHVTGKVRGLLCRKCNTGLGFFEDNYDFLISAGKYIIA